MSILERQSAVSVERDVLTGAATPQPQKAEYFPPYRLFSKAISERAQDRSVTLSLPVFEMLLQHLFLAAGFDADWYKSTYTDIAQAIEKGAMRDAITHFVQGGYREERLPRVFQVDEEWYCAKYPDVDAGIKAGKIATATEHYNSSGYVEGRYPSAAGEKIGEAWRQAIEAQSRGGAKRF